MSPLPERMQVDEGNHMQQMLNGIQHELRDNQGKLAEFRDERNQLRLELQDERLRSSTMRTVAEMQARRLSCL